VSWPSFVIALWLALGLELGLRDALEVGQSTISPSFVMVLLAFVAASAPRATALWAALAIGLALDLTSVLPASDRPEAVTPVGPAALGCVAAAYTVVVMRGSMIRRNPLTLPVLSAVASVTLVVVWVTLLEARSWYDPMVDIRAGQELWRGLLRALYTAALALPFGALLALSSPLFGFQHTGRPRPRRL
jgi:cell shape-determining protein MreD